MKKTKIIIIILTIVAIIIFFKHQKSYQLTYEKDNVTITEKYQKEMQSYLFNLTYDNFTYTTFKKQKMLFKRKLIDKIDIFKENDETCLVLKSTKISFYPLCKKNNEQISYALISDELKSKINIIMNEYNETTDEYENISIYNLLDNNFYIWNYKGFTHISQDKKEKINLVDKDIYQPKGIIKTKDYLFIPNYDFPSYYKKGTIIEAKTCKTFNWKLKKPIYFDQTILGIKNNTIYLLDKHEQIEWKINLDTKKMEKIGSNNKKGVIYQNKWSSVSVNKMLNQNLTFQGLYPITFKNENKQIYAEIENNNILFSKDDAYIIDNNFDNVYYLINDTLYMTNQLYEKIRLLKSFEWNFNYQNIIFVF